MPNAYLYIRFSTVSQEGGDSLNRQLEGGRAFIEERGWTLTETIEDLGRSAWKGKHLDGGNLGKFADRVRAGDIPPGSWLVAEKTDRLSRQGWEALFDWLREMTRKGLNIVTLDGHEFTAESMRDQINIIKILLGGEADRQFSAKISDRVQSAVLSNIKRAQNGGPKISAKCPGWMKLSDDRHSFDLIDERVAVVRMIYDLAASGRGSRWIAKHLNERSIPTWGRKQKANLGWDATTVQWILKSPAIEGDYVSGYTNPRVVKSKGHVIPGYYPRAVDADLVARARAAMAERKWSGGSNRAKVNNIFQGLVRCGYCEGRMYLNQSGDGARFFQCANAMAKRQCDHKDTYQYPAFEQSALDVVLDLALEDQWFAKADETHRLSIELAEAKKHLADQDARLQRAVDRMLDEEVGELFAARLPELKSSVAEAQQRVTEAQHALSRARGNVSFNEHQRRMMEVRDAIEHEDEETRIEARLRVAQALQGVIDRIECRRDPEHEKVFHLWLRFGALRAVIGQDGVVWEQNIDASRLVDDESLSSEDRLRVQAIRKRWEKSDAQERLGQQAD